MAETAPETALMTAPETAPETVALPTCSHYRRGCCVLAECCKEWVGCRLCHAEKFPDHEIDRHAIRQMQCLSCRTIQPCARECSSCKEIMGEYFCSVCNLFDNEGELKLVFHCDDCGICRVGGRANYYHCATCCGCYPHSLTDQHRCLQGSMHRECAICLEVTFSSLEGVMVMPCGHVLHSSCWKTYIRYGHSVCPTCRESLWRRRARNGEEANGHGEGEHVEGEHDEGEDSYGSESLIEEVDEFSDLTDVEHTESDVDDDDESGSDSENEDDGNTEGGEPIPQ